MQLFYTPDIEQADTYTFSEQESKHCVKVLRLKSGDIVHLADGAGNFFTAEICDTSIKKCLVQIIEKVSAYNKRPYFLHIAVSPTKNQDRFEWFVEKAVEIGIDEITPILCHRTEKKRMKMERIERIAISAMKQSLKAYKPVINPPVSLNTFLSTVFPIKKYIAHCLPDEKTSIQANYKKGGDAVVLIGPEGDFTEDEAKTALQVGYIPVTLGQSRLRTETAAIYACSTISMLNM